MIAKIGPDRVIIVRMGIDLRFRAGHFDTTNLPVYQPSLVSFDMASVTQQRYVLA
jgi:hypothetical protein